jgi:hypothetical protein
MLPMDTGAVRWPVRYGSIPVVLTVFAPMVLAQKHAEVMVSGEKLQFNWVGLHYSAFSIDVS